MAATCATEAPFGPVRGAEDRYTVSAAKMHTAPTRNDEQGATSPFPAHTAVAGAYTPGCCLYPNADRAAQAASSSFGFICHIFLLNLHNVEGWADEARERSERVWRSVSSRMLDGFRQYSMDTIRILNSFTTRKLMATRFQRVRHGGSDRNPDAVRRDNVETQ